LGIIHTIEVRSSYTLEKVLEESKGGLKFLLLQPGHKDLEKHLSLAKISQDILAVVLDFGLPAKIDSQVKSLDIDLKPNQWKAQDIATIKKTTGKPLVVKGVMTIEDAMSAVNLVADAIWISNNGGRSLDTMPSTVSVLRSIS